MKSYNFLKWWWKIWMHMKIKRHHCGKRISVSKKKWWCSTLILFLRQEILNVGKRFHLRNWSMNRKLDLQMRNFYHTWSPSQCLTGNPLSIQPQVFHGSVQPNNFEHTNYKSRWNRPILGDAWTTTRIWTLDGPMTTKEIKFLIWKPLKKTFRYRCHWENSTTHLKNI